MASFTLWRISLIVAGLAVLINATSVRGDEPAPDATAAYERAMTLFAEARGERNWNTRGKKLEAAHAAFVQLTAKFKNDPQSLEARSQLARVAVELARIDLGHAKYAADDTARFAALTLARQRLGDARAEFDVLHGHLRTELEALGDAPDDELTPEQIANRKLLRGKFLESQLFGAILLKEVAATYQADPAEHKKRLLAAAGEFKGIRERHRRILAGLYAQLYEGQCYQNLGTPEGATAALERYEMLLALPTASPPLQVVKVQAMKQATGCWLVKKEPTTTIEQVSQLIKAIQPTPAQLREPDWVGIRLNLARAQRLVAVDLPADSPERAEHFAAAKKLLEELVQIEGEHQAEAKKLLGEKIMP